MRSGVVYSWVTVLTGFLGGFLGGVTVRRVIGSDLAEAEPSRSPVRGRSESRATAGSAGSAGSASGDVLLSMGGHLQRHSTARWEPGDSGSRDFAPGTAGPVATEHPMSRVPGWIIQTRSGPTAGCSTVAAGGCPVAVRCKSVVGPLNPCCWSRPVTRMEEVGGRTDDLRGRRGDPDVSRTPHRYMGGTQE